MATKNITTPRGTVQYPWLTEPDFKFDPDGIYKTNFILSAEDAAPFIEKLKDAYDEGYAAELVKQKKTKLKKSDYPWEENDDGTVTFKFKLKSKIKSSKTGDVIHRKVALFDAKRVPLNPKTIKIGSGSLVRLSFQPYSWFSPSVGYGLQLQLSAAQILELREGGADRDYGFGDEGDEYEGINQAGSDFQDDGDDGLGHNSRNQDAPASDSSDEDEDF